MKSTSITICGIISGIISGLLLFSFSAEASVGDLKKACGVVYLNVDGSKGLADASGEKFRLLLNNDLNPVGENAFLCDYESSIYTLLYVGKEICAIGLEHAQSASPNQNETEISNWSLYNR